jgi:hypothetical protein
MSTLQKENDKLRVALKFEVAGQLYHFETGHLRPGKSSLTEDTSSDENWQRFEEWRICQGMDAAVTRIVELVDKIREIQITFGGLGL